MKDVECAFCHLELVEHHVNAGFSAAHNRKMNGQRAAEFAVDLPLHLALVCWRIVSEAANFEATRQRALRRPLGLRTALGEA